MDPSLLIDPVLLRGIYAMTGFTAVFMLVMLKAHNKDRREAERAVISLDCDLEYARQKAEIRHPGRCIIFYIDRIFLPGILTGVTSLIFLCGGMLDLLQSGILL